MRTFSRKPLNSFIKTPRKVVNEFHQPPSDALLGIKRPLISYLTSRPDPEKIKDIIWSWNSARLPEAERARNRGIRNLFLWWAIFIGIVAALYAYILWFQFIGPG